jgi:hypothetical protein
VVASAVRAEAQAIAPETTVAERATHATPLREGGDAGPVLAIR